MSGVVIVDCGGANLASLRYALERLGCGAVVTTDAEVISPAERVLLPGVGAAADAMNRLRASGLDRLIPELRQPVLGICLGMQLLFEGSDEGDTECLGIIPGRATRFETAPGRPVPHMGWNRLSHDACGLLDGVAPGAHAYFVHSYALPVGDHTIASTEYGRKFSAAAARDNFFGVQFHPERSAAAGARLLDNFLRMR